MNHLKTLFPACVTDNKGNMYYVTHVEHAIKELDLNTRRTRYIGNPGSYIPREWSGVDKIVFHNEKLYLFEQSGKEVMEYSLLEKTSRFFDLKYCMHNCDNWASCVVYNSTLFMFPCFSNVLIKVDLKGNGVVEKENLCLDMDFVYMHEKSRGVSKGVELSIPHRLYSCGCQTDSDIWLFTERKGIVLKYDLLTGTSIQRMLPKDIKGCIHAVWKEGLFYILSTEGSVYSWNPADGKAEMLFDSRNRYPFPYFCKIAVTDTNIWVMPCFGEDILIIDLKDGNERTYSECPKDFYYFEDPNMSKYYGTFEDDVNCYFAMHSANYLLIIEKKTGKEKWLKPVEPELYEKVGYYKDYDTQEYEESDLELKGLFMLLDEKKCDVDKAKGENTGKIMWDRLR